VPFKYYGTTYGTKKTQQRLFFEYTRHRKLS